jgi:hypothetical protein
MIRIAKTSVQTAIAVDDVRYATRNRDSRYFGDGSSGRSFVRLQQIYQVGKAVVLTGIFRDGSRPIFWAPNQDIRMTTARNPASFPKDTIKADIAEGEALIKDGRSKVEATTAKYGNPTQICCAKPL